VGSEHLSVDASLAQPGLMPFGGPPLQLFFHLLLTTVSPKATLLQGICDIMPQQVLEVPSPSSSFKQHLHDFSASTNPHGSRDALVASAPLPTARLIMSAVSSQQKTNQMGAHANASIKLSLSSPRHQSQSRVEIGPFNGAFKRTRERRSRMGKTPSLSSTQRGHYTSSL
jgi:hypothetical protein